MNCILCTGEIINYSEKFNQFKIDKSRTVSICSSCSDKFSTWQIGIAKDLFPTKMMKKRKK